MKNHSAQQGFSLVELALVLAILGLLAGGVVGGQSMIHRARVNTVISDTTQYRTAYNKFKEVYQAIPGDYADATEQWGANTVTACANTPTTADRTPNKLTCNGDGNNIILPPEHTRVWQHMANAELIDGSFTGTTDIAGGITPGENAPGGPFENATYYIDTSGPHVGAGAYFDQPQVTELAFGRSVSGSWPAGAVLTPIDHYSIDIKMDEGTPGNGKVRSLKPASNPGCASTADAATAIYDRTQTGQNCTLWMLIGEPVL